MASKDGPDWERVVTTVAAAGDVPDAPDWERIVVGSGGTPVGGSGGTPASPYPLDYGWAGWTFPFYAGPAIAAEFVGSGYCCYTSCRAVTSTTITHLTYDMRTGGSGSTAGHNYACIYSGSFLSYSSGTFTLLGQTASGTVDATINTNGFWNVPLTAGVAVTAGTLYWLMLMAGPGADSMVINAFSYGGPIYNSASGPPSFDYVYVDQTGRTTPPASVTFTNTSFMTPGVNGYMMGMY